MKLAVLAVLVVPAVASADHGVVQGVVGYSSPTAGEQYMDGVKSGGARFGLRTAWTPVQIGRAWFGADATIDWRPLTGHYGDSVSEFRALVAPRIELVGGQSSVFFRVGLGYDYMPLGDYVNDMGLAIEPGFGATYHHKGLVFGAELAVPVFWHRQIQDGQYMDGVAGADVQMMLTAGAEL